MHCGREMILTLLFVVGLFHIIAQPVCMAQITEDSRTNKNHCSGRSLEQLVVEQVAPRWPPEPGMHIKGDVTVKVTIDKNGKVVSARAICGRPLKKAFTVEAITEWKF